MEKQSKAPNFTSEQEARIRESAPLNQSKSRALAAEFGKTERSVTAKAVRMGVAYERKQPQTKSGAPVERKEAIVAQIAQLVEGNLDGLEKAPKQALQAVRNALVG
jgi:hypothetical protein